MIDEAYIHRRLERLSEIETELADPATPSNQKKYRELVREHSALRRLQEKVRTYFRLKDEIRQNREILASHDSDPELKELAQTELGGADETLAAAETEMLAVLLPPDASDARNAIMEIRAGTGGDEAALFAGDLFRMYSHYAEGKGWKVGIVDASPSNAGGYKEIVLSLEGTNVYGTMKYECGGHRVQRVPITEAAGRIHTSAATVAVFPEAEPEDDIELNPAELRVDIFCSSGPGGQSVNTTYSAIRITHLPTGLVAQSQDERSQRRNKDKAMAVLKARILDMRRQEEESKKENVRRSQIGSGDRSERIRTYNFPQNRLTDHRINLTLYSLDRIIEGELDGLLTQIQARDVELRLEQVSQQTANDKP